MGLLGPRVGAVYDRIGARPLVIPGAVLMTVVLFAMSQVVDADTPYALILGLHVVLMLSLASIFTPMFTLGLSALTPELYSHGSSLLGTTQQVAGAMGTALVVTIMTSRATSLVGDGVAPVTAQLEGLRWAFAVAAALCLVVLALVVMLPARVTGGVDAPAESDHGPEDLVRDPVDVA
jgi:DHA2 family lincomycin resistance protein-like MFS transporter